LTVGAASVAAAFGVTIALMGVAAAPAQPAEPTRCVPRGIHFGNARYERERLDRSFVAVGRVLGVASDVGGCVDTILCVIGQPCEPPPSNPPAQIRVFRLKGISPRAAVSEGGSSRSILVARDRCMSAFSDRALLRCLRRSDRA
jgi:hypothetical protein